MTFTAMTGEWNRNLALDLDTVRDWGAAAVVTLLEPKELTLLEVECACGTTGCDQDQ